MFTFGSQMRVDGREFCLNGGTNKPNFRHFDDENNVLYGFVNPK